MSRLRFLLVLSIFLLISGCVWQSTEISGEKPPLGIENGSEQNIEPERQFYFGYGSNMNLGQMGQRCGKEHFDDLGLAILDDYQFYFYGHGHANIRPQLDEKVEGVLFKIDLDCLQALDRVEGYPHVYQRQIIKVNYQDKSALAQVYIVQNDQTIAQPSLNYYQVVLTGAQEHKLSEEYIDYITALAGY